MKKGSKLYSVVRIKCPRCQEGDLFENPNPYKLSESLKMKERCPVCGLKYEMETGFFYGSMYVSYGLSIAFSVAVLVAMYVFSLFLPFEFDLINYLIINGILLVLTMPVMFRLSRAMWMIMFIKYDPQAAKNKS